MAKVIVAGAGINGVSSAIWLQRAGHNVVLIDRDGPAAGTSYGNAGVLAAGSIIPVTTPGLLGKIPKMLFNRNAPLFVRWGYLPKAIPFLTRYLSHANLDHVRLYAKVMSELLYDTVDQHRALAAGTGAEKYITNDDYFFGYDSEEAFKADAFAWEVRKRNGLKFQVLNQGEFEHLDPIYKNQFKLVVANKNHGKISDPGAYIRTLAEYFVSNGGTLLKASVEGLIDGDRRLLGLKTDQGNFLADHVIFTLGPWSGGISKKLGLSIPFESERGYHIELVNPSMMPKAPIMVASGKFVVTPMDGRIRLAGVVEFGGLDAGPSKAPIELLKRNAVKLFPDLKYDRIDEWLGHRPTTANSLPLIGRINKYDNVLTGFGHQHVGLTGGAKTGRILAGLLDQDVPNIDLGEFDPNRYAQN
jgi:D-amino-acid dehydrogenase